MSVIDPAPEDIGRGVIYHPAHGGNESGTVHSYNKSYVFVRYGRNQHTKATRRQDLEWCWEQRQVAGGTPAL